MLKAYKTYYLCTEHENRSRGSGLSHQISLVESCIVRHEYMVLCSNLA